MFDTYKPSRSVRCPTCGRELEKWQGKDGPCARFVWTEGSAAPIAQDVDDEIALPVAERAAIRLPETFTIYSYDCPEHGPIEARCRCVDGVWVGTVVIDGHTSNLIDRFIAQECTPDVRRLLEEAIADEAMLRPHFEFNLFEITIERAEGSVLIEDVLDATEAGSQRVALADFVAALGRCSG